MMLSVMAAVAQYQSDIKSERTREAIAIKKMLGTVAKQRRDGMEWIDSEHVSQRNKTSEELPQDFTVHIYNRISVHDKRMVSLGMEVQRECNQRTAERIAKSGGDVKFATYEDDSVSAFSVPFTKRPAASRMLAALIHGDHIVIYRGDRAFRNARQCCEFVELCMKNKIVVHLTREGASTRDEFGRLFFKILSIFAEIESETRRRQKLQVNDNMAARGRPICNYPRQYKCRKINGKKQLVYDFDELKHMTRSWLMRKMGYPWEQIRRTLQAYHCQDKKIKPGLVCKEFVMSKTKRRGRRMDEILSKLGAEVTSDLVADAVSHLSRPISETYLSWCKHPVPIQCTWDRLVGCGIDPTILGSLPDAPVHQEPSQA
jgi:DNA invertase Pin-like site-specific DNA recombinase